MRWLVEALLAPARVTPDPEAMRRGSRAHAVLEATLRRLEGRDGLGGAHAGVAARGARGARRARSTASSSRARARRAPRGGRSRPTSSATCATRPSAARGSSPSTSSGASGARATRTARSALGELSITGRVDRVDVGPGGEAIVRDYKGATAPPGAGWAEGGALQVALYMLAARELLGLEPVGGLYQALWAKRVARRAGWCATTCPAAT